MGTETFIQRLRAWREARGVTIRGGAKRARIHPETLRMLEAGEAVPHLHQVVALAAVLEVSVAALVAPGPVGLLPPHASQTLLPEHADERFRARIRRLRTARRWGTPRLARAAGLHQSGLARIENGSTSRIRLDHALRIAAALEVSLEALIGDAEIEAEMTPRRCRWPDCGNRPRWGRCCMRCARRLFLILRQKPTAATDDDIKKAARAWKEWHP